MRLFVAIRLPEEIIPALERAALPLKGALGARLLPPQSWHITLKFIGEAPQEKLGRIQAALGAVQFKPFVVHLFGAGAFPSERVPRAIWVGGESQGAAELAEKVEDALSFLSLPRERFFLHLTLARSKGAADIEEFLKTGEVGRFEARSFCLMKSSLAAQGAIYEVLKEFAAQEG